MGAEIHPAARKQSFTEDGREDDERKLFSVFYRGQAKAVPIVCREVEEDMSRGLSICRATASGLLDW